MDFKNSRIKLIHVLFIITIVYWLTTFIPDIYYHFPWRDEAHAWQIAKNLNIIEIFQYMKYEGHMFIWYLILMPFAKTNFFYPYSMQITNLLLVFGSIFLLFKYSPFNAVIKCLISCSLIYSITALFARCYGVGIFLLTLALVLYKDRMKHPVAYALILLLAANTSIVAMFGAFTLGALFIFELYIKRNKTNDKNDVKNFVIVSLIGLLAFIIVFLQIGGASIPNYTLLYKKTKMVLTFHMFWPNNKLLGNLFSILFFLLCFLSPVLFKKNLKPFVFLITTSLSIACFSHNFYLLNCYHFVFLPFYLILGIWMYLSENEAKDITQKTYLISFYIFIALLTWYSPNLGNLGLSFSDYSCEIINDLKEKKEDYTKGKWFVYCREFFTQYYPYLEKEGYNLYDAWGEPVNSYQHLINRWEKHDVNFDKIKQVAASDDTYIIVRLEYNETFLNQAKESNVKLTKIKQYEGNTIYKMDFRNFKSLN